MGVGSSTTKWVGVLSTAQSGLHLCSASGSTGRRSYPASAEIHRPTILRHGLWESTAFSSGGFGGGLCAAAASSWARRHARWAQYCRRDYTSLSKRVRVGSISGSLAMPWPTVPLAGTVGERSASASRASSVRVSRMQPVMR